MVGRRRLRRLVPDGELFERRAAGESLRALALDYGVAQQLRAAGRRLAAEGVAARRALAAARVEERRLLRQLREQARAEAVLAREHARQAAAPRPRRRSADQVWLDEHDQRRPLTRAQLGSRNDQLAAQAVAAGGGLEAVIEATGLRTRANVLRLIEPAIVLQALAQETA